MAKVQTAIVTQTIVNAAEVTFAAKFEAFEAAVSGHAFNKSESKDSLATLNAAKREVSWAAVDLAAGDADALVKLAVQIATREGVKEDAMRVIAQRARDVVAFWPQVSKADRTKHNPFTVAKKVREERNKVNSAAAENAPHIGDALSLAAGALETTVAELQAQIMAGDGSAREALDAALVEVKARAAVVADAERIAAMLSKLDDETATHIRALFA